MLKIGNQRIPAAYLGGVKIKKAYLGEAVVFDTSDPPAPTYAITVGIAAGSGTVSGAGTYQAGETVTITATPGDGYDFTGWQEDGVTVSEDEAYSFTVTGDRMLMAVFAAASRLPAGYTELKYVYAPNNSPPYTNGPAYLSDGVLDLYITVDETPTGTCDLFYCNQTSSSKYYFVSIELRKAGFYIMTYPGAANTTVGAVQLTTSITPGDYHIHVDVPNKTASVNDITKNIANMATANAYAQIGPTLDNSKSSSIKFRECIIKNASSTANNRNMHLVPCKKSTGTIGFYDLHSNKFYGPGNTNYPWAAGPAV